MCSQLYVSNYTRYYTVTPLDATVNRDENADHVAYEMHALMWNQLTTTKCFRLYETQMIVRE